MGQRNIVMDTIPNLDLPDGRSTKYQALSDGLRRAIAEGRIAAGARLPTVRELAFRLGVTPGTVQRAYQRLTEAGVLEAHVGRGTYVAERRVAPAQSGILDLTRPHVSDMGQAAMIRKAMRRLAEGGETDLLDYPDRAAGRPVREGLLRDLDGVEMGPVTADDLILTHGAQHAYIVVLQTVLNGASPQVATEELAYPGFRHGARLMRADMVGIPMDEEGPIPEALAEACDAGDIQVFTTSSFAQNPTTIQTSVARREAIAGLAREKGFQIIEDECYGRTPPGLLTYRALAPERVWYLGSMSKSFSAALRIGFLIAPEGRLPEVRQASHHNSFGISRPIAAVAAEVLASPDWPKVRAAVDRAYSERMAIIAEVLDGFQFTWREGIPFAFLRLPAGWRTSGFVRAAEVRGVKVRPADDFVLIDGRAPNAVRLAVDGRAPLNTFRAGIEELRSLLTEPPHEMDV